MQENAKLRRFQAGAQAMSARERAALHAAMTAARQLKRKKDRQHLLELITGIGAARGRTLAKQASDRRTDAARRQLVGARLPKAQAERCRSCAALRKVSLYRFAVDALDAACAAVERDGAVTWDGQQHVCPSSPPIVQRR